MGKARWTSNDNIFLVGPMGAGKTTIGLQIARQFGRHFYDSDKEIEKRTGATIPLIFELEGEEGFRKRESQVIQSLAELKQAIIATGGGAVIKAENRAVLKEHGLIIYLKADLEHLLERTQKDKNRPLLQTENPKLRLKEILEQREPLYEEVADIVVKTGDQSIKSVVEHITRLIKAKLGSL